MPVLNITGSLSPHIDDTVTFNGRLDPAKTNWMKVSAKIPSHKKVACLTILLNIHSIYNVLNHKFWDLWP